MLLFKVAATKHKPWQRFQVSRKLNCRHTLLCLWSLLRDLCVVVVFRSWQTSRMRRVAALVLLLWLLVVCVVLAVSSPIVTTEGDTTQVRNIKLSTTKYIYPTWCKYLMHRSKSHINAGSMFRHLTYVLSLPFSLWKKCNGMWTDGDLHCKRQSNALLDISIRW